MKATPQATRVLPLIPETSSSMESSRDTILEISAVARLLDLSSEHGWKPIEGSVAVGLSEILLGAAERMERQYSRLYLRGGLKF